MTLSDQSRKDMIMFALSRYDAYGKDDELANKCVEIIVSSILVETVDGLYSDGLIPDDSVVK